MNTPPTIIKFLGTTILAALMGVGIGSLFELMMSIVWGGGYSPGVPSFLGQFDDPMVGIVWERVGYALLGIVGHFSSLLFEVESMRLIVASVIHYAIIVVAFVTTALCLHWFPSVGALIGGVVSFSVVYLVIWLVNWLSARHRIEQINAQLQSQRLQP